MASGASYGNNEQDGFALRFNERPKSMAVKPGFAGKESFALNVVERPGSCVLLYHWGFAFNGGHIPLHPVCV